MCAAVPNGSINWSWSRAKGHQTAGLGREDTSSRLQASHEAGRNLGGATERGQQNLNEKVGRRWGLPLRAKFGLP